MSDRESADVAYNSFVDWESIRNEVIVLKPKQQHRLAAIITLKKGAVHVKSLAQNMNILIDFARKKALEYKDKSQNSYDVNKLYFALLLVFTIALSIITVFFVIFLVRRAEHSLNASEKRLSLVLEASEDGVWDWNIITNKVFFSPRWCEIIGYSYSDPELAHNFISWKSRIHPNEVDDVMLALSNHLQNGTVYNVDYRHRHKSGKYRWQNSQGKASSNKEGKPIRMVGVIQDIIRRKENEQELKNIIEKLKKSKDKLKLAASVFSHARESIVITDAAGTTITGYSRNEVIGQNPRILKSGRQPSEFYVAMWKALRGKDY